MVSAKIQSLVDRGTLFAINHSGGKDSQAMLAEVLKLVPRDQILVIHADLGEVDWGGTIEQIQDTIGDLPLIVCRSRRGLLQMVEERGMWPSPQQRQCTSDLKRGPIEREIRRYLKANPRFNGLVVNCMGLRAEESSARAKAKVFKKNDGNSLAGREWYDWLPIHDWKVGEVFAAIAAAGQTPHWAYAEGMSRLSCCFCIMASRSDLTTAARLNPALYARHVALEKRISHTMSMERKGLEEVTGIAAGQAFKEAT